MHFVTDTLENETDILQNLKHEFLKLQDLDGRSIKVIAPPPGGWTHEALNEVAETHEKELYFGGDAYLGTDWVGSTEV